MELLVSLDHSRAPLWENIEGFRKKLKAAFYCPGHNGGRSLPLELGQSYGLSDLNNLPDTDTLHCPSGSIQQAERLLADAYGVQRTFMMVGGSSLGNIAAVMSSVGPGDTILVQRNAHKSIIAGIIHSGAVPVWLPAQWDKSFGIVHGLSTEIVIDALRAHPSAKALVVLNPTYFGVVADLPSIVAAMKDRRAVLIVDEAHGPHFRFVERWCESDSLPVAAESHGADLVVQSTHKILSALSQAAVLHVCTDKVDPLRVQAVLQSLQTTSPNFAIMASIDLARRQMMQEGQARIQSLIDLAIDVRHRLAAIPGVRVLEQYHATGSGTGFYRLDPTKLVIATTECGWSGIDAHRYLNDQFGVQPELSGPNYVLCILTIGSTPADCDCLVSALESLSQTPPSGRLVMADVMSLAEHASRTLPEMVMPPREAFYASHAYVSLEQAVGHISGEIITPYPPGIPVIMPGERFGADTIDLLSAVRATGCPISSVDPTLNRIRIL